MAQHRGEGKGIGKTAPQTPIAPPKTDGQGITAEDVLGGRQGLTDCARWLWKLDDEGRFFAKPWDRS